MKTPKWKQYLFLYAFGLFKIPMIFFVRPRIVRWDDAEARILIPFKRRNRNHLRSIYVGALVVGADLCAGGLALHHARKSGKPILPVFKDMSCEFLKRANGPTEFVCAQGAEIAAMVARVAQTGERQTQTLTGQAFSLVQGERIHVMNFKITLSLK